MGRIEIAYSRLHVNGCERVRAVCASSRAQTRARNLIKRKHWSTLRRLSDAAAAASAASVTHSGAIAADIHCGDGDDDGDDIARTRAEQRLRAQAH